MTYMYCDDRENAEKETGFDRLLSELEEGDCMVVERFSGAARSAKGFLSLMEELDSRGIRFRSVEEGFDSASEKGRYALDMMSRVARLDGEYRAQRQREGINNAKEDGKYKGRKPIEVDEDTFDAILERWKNGEITARQAMNELGLKPNTFYRRVKERMTETKSGEAIFNAARQFGKDMAAGAEEFSQAAGKLASECDPSAMVETIGKNISAAGRVLGKSLENLSKDFQEALERVEQESAAPEAEAAAPAEYEIVEEPAEAETVKEAPAAEEFPGEQDDKEWI